MRQGIFLPESTLSALSYGVHAPPCAVVCIYICVRIKDPIVHVRVHWTMERLKRPVCTLGWVAQLCRSWLSPGKATRISHRRNSIGTIQLQKKKKKVPTVDLGKCVLFNLAFADNPCVLVWFQNVH